MSYINTTVIASADGTYGMINSIIGQIKTILLNDTNVSIISDNDPANTTARTVIYSIASQTHYMKITAATSATIKFAILKLDQSTDLITFTTNTISAGTAYPAMLLYSSKVHSFFLYLNSTSYKYAYTFVDCGDPVLGWYCLAHSGTSFGYAGSDTTGSISAPTAFTMLTTGGKMAVIPLRFYISSNILDYYNPSYGKVNTTLLPYGFYTDDTYHYLSMGGSSSDFIISDQVFS